MHKSVCIVFVDYAYSMLRYIIYFIMYELVRHKKRLLSCFLMTSKRPLHTFYNYLFICHFVDVSLRTRITLLRARCTVRNLKEEQTQLRNY